MMSLDSTDSNVWAKLILLWSDANKIWKIFRWSVVSMNYIGWIFSFCSFSISSYFCSSSTLIRQYSKYYTISFPFLTNCFFLPFFGLLFKTPLGADITVANKIYLFCCSMVWQRNRNFQSKTFVQSLLSNRCI
jgi:hypothetical protein